MPDLVYFEEIKTLASDYEVTGQRLVEVWTNPVSFQTWRERCEYLSNNPTEHCLAVELTLIDGTPTVIFFYDDQPANIEPRYTIPSEAELIALLEEYNG